MSLVVASYNIHRCYGRDGRHDPERIKKVLQEIDADVIALQEVELLHEAPELLDYLCHNRHWKPIKGLTMSRDSGHYGNAVLTALPVRSVERYDLSIAGLEPRGALAVKLTYRDQSLQILATHLGLRSHERRFQVRRILDILATGNEAPISILMGDLNEWFLWGRPLRWLRNYFDRFSTLASFPARFPVLALDRILVRPHTNLDKIHVHNSKLARIASDHLPVVAWLK